MGVDRVRGTGVSGSTQARPLHPSVQRAHSTLFLQVVSRTFLNSVSSRSAFLAHSSRVLTQPEAP